MLRRGSYFSTLGKSWAPCEGCAAPGPLCRSRVHRRSGRWEQAWGASSRVRPLASCRLSSPRAGFGRSRAKLIIHSIINMSALQGTVVLLIGQVRARVRVYAQVSVLGRFCYTLVSQVWWRGQLRFTPRFRNFPSFAIGPWEPEPRPPPPGGAGLPRPPSPKAQTCRHIFIGVPASQLGTCLLIP